MKLAHDLFYLIVFGPGFGESIALRDPSGTWIIIDGCRANRRSMPEALLVEQSARWSAVILTHRHEDHAAGLDAVLARAGGGLVGCVDVDPGPPSWRRSHDSDKQERTGTVEEVLAAIELQWSREPESEWQIRRGQKRVVGEVELLALHPDDATVDEQPHNPNRLASALVVTWKSVRLVLGSDTLTEDWASAGNIFAGLNAHHGLKVPHHGSSGAVHVCWGDGANDRFWICTPFNRGQRLPRYEDGEGLEWALQRVDRVHLTGLPVAHAAQSTVPYVTTRAALLSGEDPPPEAREASSKLVVSLQNEESGADTCFVAAGFRPDGTLADLQHGPGSVVVYETLPVEETDPQPVEAA